MGKDACVLAVPLAHVNLFACEKVDGLRHVLKSIIIMSQLLNKLSC